MLLQYNAEVTQENPFGGSERAMVPEPPSELAGTTQLAGVSERFPVWGLADVFKVAVLAIVAIFFCTIAALFLASGLPIFRTADFRALATDPRVIVPGQTVGYLIVVGYIHRMITRHYQMEFREAIRWRWVGFAWPGYLALGAVLAVAIQGLSHYLPIPKQMPIDQMFRNYSGAWVMLIFGVAVAPLVEELFFRGLLFPALSARIGLVAGITITSFLFALIHASQLGKAWGPVLILFLVGLVLTLVRSRAKSVAASFVVHTGYNLTLFLLLYVSSDGFRHLDRLFQ